jgi:hypothetical protein
VRPAAVLVAAAAIGCSSPPQSPTDAPADGSAGGDCFGCVDASVEIPLTVQVRGVLDTTCAADGCHLMGAGNLAISPGAEFTQLVDVFCSEVPGVLRVKPGDPAQSYVYWKLACEGGIEGGCMPLGGHLDPTLVRAFHDWIEAGAVH